MTERLSAEQMERLRRLASGALMLKTDQRDAAKAALNRLEVLENVVAHVLESLADVLARSTPTPPGGQQVSPSVYQASHVTRMEFKRLLNILTPSPETPETK